jgi:hypothetical protein
MDHWQMRRRRLRRYTVMLATLKSGKTAIWRMSMTSLPPNNRFRPRREGRDHAPVYGWFTEGFDTRDLKDAKMLLKELAP